MLRATLDKQGFALIPQLFGQSSVAQLIDEIAALPPAAAISQRAGTR